MCGIAGIYNFKSGKPVVRSQVDAMCLPIAHRGPDGSGIYLSGPIGLGHRRLSIIDIASRSDQPLHNQSQSAVVCYNGEIYNYREIRPDLESRGYPFRTESDTEVLLALYENEGVQCLERLNGMFAFAIWDDLNNSLFLARDRLGIKPLYYCLTDDGLIFASEIKSILRALSERPELESSAIDSFMSFGYVPGEQTMFRGIQRLMPGHYLLVQDGHVECRQYWDFSVSRQEDRGFQYYSDKAIELLKDSVRLQLRSDVPLGVFLSGGVDSSAVVAMMHSMDIDPIKTFSVRWDHGPKFDEAKYARKISKKFGTEHYEHTMSDNDFVQFLPKFQWLMDEPVTEAAAISLYHIASKASDEVTVVLSGEGADEVFGGYPIYRFMRWVDRYRLIPAAIRRTLTDPVLRHAHPKLSKYVDMSRQSLERTYFGVSFYDAAIKSSVYNSHFQAAASAQSAAERIASYYEHSAEWDTFSRMQYLDVKTWLVDDLLIKADRMSMAASLELRVPFLDHRFFEFSGTIPTKYLVGEFESKKLLKHALEPYLPREILYRKKMGFPTPVAELLRGPLGDLAHDMFSSRRFFNSDFFDSDAVASLLEQHRNRTQDNHRILWQLLIFELWCNSFLDT